MKESLLALNILLIKKAKIEEEKKAVEFEISSFKKSICDQFFPVKVGDEVIANGEVATGATIVVDKVVLSIIPNGFEFRALGCVRSELGVIDYGRGTGKASYPIII